MAELVTAELVETFIGACEKEKVPHDPNKMRKDFKVFLANAEDTVNRRGGRGQWIESVGSMPQLKQFCGNIRAYVQEDETLAEYRLIIEKIAEEVRWRIMLEVNDIRTGLIRYLQSLAEEGAERVVWCMKDFASSSSAGQALAHLVSRSFQDKKIDLHLIKDILGDDAETILERYPFYRQEKEITPEHIKKVLREFIEILPPGPWNTNVARKMKESPWPVIAMDAYNALDYLQKEEPGVPMNQKKLEHILGDEAYLLRDKPYVPNARVRIELGVSVVKTKPLRTKPVEVAPAEAKSAKVDLVKVEPMKTEPVKTGSVEAAPAEAKLVETAPVKIVPANPTPLEVAPVKPPLVESKPVQVESAQTTQTRPAFVMPTVNLSDKDREVLKEKINTALRRGASALKNSDVLNAVNKLMIFYNYNNNPDQALLWFTVIASGIADVKILATFDHNRAVAYLVLKKPQEAIKLLTLNGCPKYPNDKHCQSTLAAALDAAGITNEPQAVAGALSQY